MNQKEYFGWGSIKNLEEIIKKENPKNIFLVTGKSSYTSSGAQEQIEKILFGMRITRFSDFSINPKLEEIQKGIDLFKKIEYDLVIAVGGGSPIDVAKSINLLSLNSESAKQYITGKSQILQAGKPFVAIPTTSGSGSEATKFAVVYINKQKYSLASDLLLPTYSIIDPQFVMSLPAYQTAATGMDALSQTIESYWSIHSTSESKGYSKDALKLLLENLEGAVNSPTKENKEKVAKASNLAGKAINITFTTACHAISYPLTSHYGVSHGHAVGLTLGEMLNYIAKVSKKDCLDKRGPEYVTKSIKEILEIMQVETPEEGKNKIKTLMDKIGLKTKLSELGINEIELIIENGFNPQRVKNNPRKITKEDLKRILQQIM
jgi:alcohol dehydrogenase